MKQSSPAKRTITFLALLAIFIAAPLLGVFIRGGSVARYLQFPPVTTTAGSSSFSWIAFGSVLLFVILTTLPFWRRLGRKLGAPGAGRQNAAQQRFPWWGWLAAAGVILFWVLAWNRFSWFEPLQRHTFFPLWFSFTVLLNACAVRISGRCLMTHRPLFFLLLFPFSAVFWWAFEYLNRFVNNWYYTGVAEISGWQYFGEASLAFSTVLPAVLSVLSVLLHTGLFSSAYRDFPEFPWITSRRIGGFIGVVSAAALMGIGWMPEYTYPLIWIVPGLMWIVYQRWNNYVNPLLKEVSRGDFTLVWSSAVAALLCGFFWEMWNLYSEAKWVYSIPALDRFHLFEMPLLGYAGYLPFGVICALAADSLRNLVYH